MKVDVHMEPNKIASYIQKNSTKNKGDKTTTRRIKAELRRIKSTLPKNAALDRSFLMEELYEAIA